MISILANSLLAIAPTTRAFRLKAILLRLMRFRIGPATRICGSSKFNGTGRVEIGASCWIGMRVCFYSTQDAAIYIGDGCDIAPNVVFHTGTHHIGPPTRRAGPQKSADIVVGAGCWIGVGSTILAGANIGSGCVVAAGSVVQRGAYLENTLLAGNPARPAAKLN